MMTTLTRRQDLGSLLMRVFRHFSVVLTFLLTVSYFCFLLEYGTKIHKADLNTVLFYTERIS